MNEHKKKIQIGPLMAYDGLGSLPREFQPKRPFITAYELTRLINDIIDRGYVRIKLDLALPTEGLE